MSSHDPSMRVSNAEREAIIAKLHAATEEGRLDLDEFAERSQEAYAARTYGDLEHLLADLPHTEGQVAVPESSAAAPHRAAEAPAELRLTPKASSLQRKGEWRVPRRIKVSAKASSIKLDFRHAVIATREVDIDLDDTASSIEIVLPAGAHAEEDLDAWASSVHNRSEHRGTNGLRFSVTGKIKASSVSIRYERRFLWWRW